MDQCMGVNEDWEHEKIIYEGESCPLCRLLIPIRQFNNSLVSVLDHGKDISDILLEASADVRPPK